MIGARLHPFKFTERVIMALKTGMNPCAHHVDTAHTHGRHGSMVGGRGQVGSIRVISRLAAGRF